MKQYEAFECDFCRKIYKNEHECISHEVECSYNPDTHKCDTCKFLHSHWYGDDSCSIWDEKETFEYWDERKTCPYYERKELTNDNT